MQEPDSSKEVKVIRLKNQKQRHKKKDKDDYLIMCLCVAKHYPQYTLEQVANELPFRLVKSMYDYIQSERANTLLLLNGIINGPNEQGKQKKSYRQTIDILTELAEK